MIGRVFVRALAVAIGLIALWSALHAALALPPFVLPGPWDVAGAFAERGGMLLRNAAITASEMVIGLLIGVAAGVVTALAIASTPFVRRILLPPVVVTQSLPVFAIAPLLVVWLGYGIASKIVMAALIIYFPVATAYADAMVRAPRDLIDMARFHGATPVQLLFLVRAPFGVPGLAAGLKVAATVAPIGAVVGEWVGSSAGLGYVMLHANARLQTDVVFAALILLAALALLLRSLVESLARRLAPWQEET